MQRIVTYLKQIDAPLNIMHELHFMDFSHDDPTAPTRFLTSATPHAPDELALSIVLTTSHAALANQIVADSTQSSTLPQIKTLRWTNAEDVKEVPLIDWINDPDRGVTPLQIQNAHARLLTCRKTNLVLHKTGPRPRLVTFCLSTIWGIILTQNIVGRTLQSPYGVLTVTKRGHRWFVEVTWTTRAEFDQVQMRQPYKRGMHMLEDVGRFSWDGALEVPDKEFIWSDLIDTTGRVREGAGRDWE